MKHCHFPIGDLVGKFAEKVTKTKIIYIFGDTFPKDKIGKWVLML